MKSALITGVLGQDGSYMAEHLLGLGYKVHGLTRRNTETSDLACRLKDKVTFLYGDMQDRASLESAIWKSKPDEIYNFAGQVFVPVSWSNPDLTFDVNVGGLARLAEIAMRLKPDTKIYQASSSEMYGDFGGDADESTQFSPNSPYGASKFAAHALCQVYKKAGLFIASGICFNHESPRRGSEMVTQKIVKHVARWVVGDKDKLRLGNMRARRDWGYAKDYVLAMQLMLQNDEPLDYVIGTGESHSVEDFVLQALHAAGLPIGYLSRVIIDDRLVRTNDIRQLRAKPLLINSQLGWKSSTSFEQLVRIMMDSELESLFPAKVV
jgi:GDPmannose 4,6-dehydratase